MNSLPESYCNNMRILLGEEYEEYIKSFSQESYTAVRVNTAKISLDKWEKQNPFCTEPVSWTEKGFYYQADKEKPSKHPYYYAGLYYIQEPSAMIPASILPVLPGDRVLDLCAAPGGKATELGAKLDGTGLLVANDISVSRAMALAKNIQFAGITNAVVTAETPQKLARHFGSYFDKILIDAPCSGEGMFRREPRMVKDWLEKGPDYYSTIQKEILTEAYRMLKPGGKLVYSTCTFAVKEDEAVIQWLLDQYPDMQICPVERKEGFSKGRPDLVENGSDALRDCIRIFPHRAKGEGHFAVLLQKTTEDNRQNVSLDDGMFSTRVERNTGMTALQPEEKQVRESDRKRDKKQKGKGKKGRSFSKQQESGIDESAVQQMYDFVHQLRAQREQKWCDRIERTAEALASLPVSRDTTEGIRVVYQGIPVCEWKHRLLPSSQLALTLRAGDAKQVWNLSAEDEQVIRYLKGETLTAPEPYQGMVLVCVDGYGLGWAQGNGKGMLKNKYYPGWRYQ